MNYIIFFIVFGALCLDASGSVADSMISISNNWSQQNNSLEQSQASKLIGKVTIANQKKMNENSANIQEQTQGSLNLLVAIPDVSEYKEFMGCSFERNFDKAMIGIESDIPAYKNFLVKTLQKEAVHVIRDMYHHYVDNLERTYQEQPRIPKIIHQIWIGPHEFPKDAYAWQKTWQEMHPDWEYKLWTNADIDEFGMENIDAFNQAKNWGEKADIWRYEIIYRYGGVYVDVDEKCIRSFDSLHHTCDFYIAVHNLLLILHHNNKLRINNAVFGACPAHPLLGKAVEQIKYNRNMEHLLERTGPDFITKVILNDLGSSESADFVNVILPANYFYPCAERGKNRVKINPHAQIYIMPETFAVHYYTSYWLTPPREKKTANTHKTFQNFKEHPKVNQQSLEKKVLTEIKIKQFRDFKSSENFDRAMLSVEGEWEKYGAGLQKIADKTFFEAINNHYKEYIENLENIYGEQPKIPKIIHQIWLDAHPFPEEARALQESWQKMHPDWEYILWTNDDVENLSFENKRFYHAAKNRDEKADILRYEILYQFGGLYVALDEYCVMPFDILHHTCDFYAGLQQTSPLKIKESKVRVNNAIIGCVPGHPILQRAVNRIKKTRAHEDILQRTGVDFFSKAVASKFNKSIDLGNIDVVFPATYFYPSTEGLKVDTIKADVEIEVRPEDMALHYFTS